MPSYPPSSVALFIEAFDFSPSGEVRIVLGLFLALVSSLSDTSSSAPAGFFTGAPFLRSALATAALFH